MATKKKPLKKAAKKVVKSRSATAKVVPMKSFHLYKEPKPFTKFSITRQTVYWLILLIVVLVTQLWILKIQMDIANLTTIVTNQ
jgi:hypothetical protein